MDDIGNRKIAEDVAGADYLEALTLMSDRHGMVNSHLKQCESELELKQRMLASEWDKWKKLEGQICIAEQNLRTLNEKAYLLDQDSKKKEASEKELIHELVRARCNTRKKMSELEKSQNAMEQYEKSQQARIQEVKAATAYKLPEEWDPDYTELMEEVESLKRIKTGLEKKDPGLMRIFTGEAIRLIDMQKAAVYQAISDKELEVDVLQSELDDKVDAIKNTQDKIVMQEKLNHEKMMELQKQLQDLDETEKHLKSTVQYMEKQIDFGTTTY